MNDRLQRRIALAAAILLVVLVGVDLTLEHHPYFGIDGTPGFGAWFGALSALVSIALAIVWGAVGHREERPDD